MAGYASCASLGNSEAAGNRVAGVLGGSIASSDHEGIEALVNQWFIHLSNHLDREAARRPLFDPDIYIKGVKWKKLR
jgi:hypothetical protein